MYKAPANPLGLADRGGPNVLVAYLVALLAPNFLFALFGIHTTPARRTARCLGWPSPLIICVAQIKLGTRPCR